MDLRLPNRPIVEDITDQTDAPELQRDTTSNLASANISNLLANANPGRSNIRKSLSLLEASLATHTFVPDEPTSKQIWKWILDNVFDSYITGKVDDRNVDYKTALRVLLRVYDQNNSLRKDLLPSQISSLIICSTGSADKDISLAADELLSLLLHEEPTARPGNSHNLTTILLADVVRPAFARSRSKNITAAGRKVIDPLPQALTASEDEQSLKPWKFTHRYVIRLLKWILEHSSAKVIEENWGLITPPILTIIDDEATDSKIDGCSLLQILLEKVSAAIWTRTGLGKVFEEALNPVLAYLPPLVEQDEAEKMIDSIYPTLLSLCHHQFSAPDQRARRMAMLDNLMRAGVLSGLSQSGENIKVSILLLNQMCVLLSQMEIYCVKHLKSIVPILVSYLCDPFAFASPVLLHSVLAASNCLILNAWPRMERYSGELFKGIATCWQRLSEESMSEPISDIRQDLTLTLKLLMEALQGNNMAKEIETLLKNDGELAKLLP